MLTRIAIVLLAFGFVACATSEIVYMKNDAGKTVKCGPYTTAGNVNAAAMTSHQKLRDCMMDYERQGYKRVPEPQP